MANNTISKSDKAKMFDYLKDYQDNIKQNFGNYDYDNKLFQKFISTNDIYLGRLNNICKSEASKHQYYILFEQDKPYLQKRQPIITASSSSLSFLISLFVCKYRNYQ